MMKHCRMDVSHRLALMMFVVALTAWRAEDSNDY